MRKFAFMLLLLMYLLPAAGMSVQAHYCGDDLESISLFGLGDLGCCCGDEEGDPADCCGEKLAVFHFEDVQHFSHQPRVPLQPLAAILPTPAAIEGNFPPHQTHSWREHIHADPPDHAPPLFLQFSQLLI